MRTRKTLIVAITASAAMAVVSVGLVLSLRGHKGPDFAGMQPQEIKAYFNSDSFRRLNAGDQIAIKKQAYGPSMRQQEQAFIEQAKTYSKLPPQKKIRFLDEKKRAHIMELKEALSRRMEERGIQIPGQGK